MEVLISILLVSTVVLALATGMLTLVRTTESNRQRQQIQLALGNLSEGVRAMDYIDCGDRAAYRSAYEPDPANGRPNSANWMPTRSGMTYEIVSVEYWDPTSRTFGDDPCSTDAGAQQLTLRVDWRGREGTTQVVIRR
jgi:Tfp pilus assembly protein PilV